VLISHFVFVEKNQVLALNDRYENHVADDLDPTLVSARDMCMFFMVEKNPTFFLSIIKL
jgi:mannitol-specific phosphotransferase system IIBC component